MVEKETFKITDKTAKYRTEIQQMMFVSGETGDPPVETTTLIESIVQQQVIEMLTQATTLAARRGVRSIAIEDLIFLIRHDKAKVSRLRTFLSWKDVRKNVKDNDDNKGGGADDLGVGGPGGPDDVLAGDAGKAGGADAAAKNMNKQHKKAKVRLPWDVASLYSVQVPERDDDENERDEEEEEMNSATLLRLKNADERTKNMTREEYVHFSECRQASFTYRKGKRFREWADFATVTDSKPNDDVIDILGFLTFEMVQTLTEEALRVKAVEDAWLKVNGGGEGKESAGAGGGGGGDEGEGGVGRKRKREMGLFEPAEEERTPVQPKHVLEAFRRLQQPSRKLKALGNFNRVHVRRGLKLI